MGNRRTWSQRAQYANPGTRKTFLHIRMHFHVRKGTSVLVRRIAFVFDV